MSTYYLCPVRGCWKSSFDYPDFKDHVVAAHGWTERGAWEDFKRQRRAKQLARLHAGRSRMQGWTLDTFPAHDVSGRRALNTMRAWAGEAWEGDWPPRVYLYGPPGTGKTGLAVGVARAWVETDEPVEFHNVRALLAAQRSRFASGEGSEEPSAVERLLDFYPDGGLAVLDDLGAERPTEYALETVALIVEHLHAEDVPLIVTTNYAPSELSERLGKADRVVGQRIVSRLIEDALRIKLDRPDLRARPARASEAV